MSYATMSIDRRAQYYARCAPLIAADPLDFYTRAEKGRQLQTSRLKSPGMTGMGPAQVVAQCLSAASMQPSAAAQHRWPLLPFIETTDFLH